MTAKEFRRQRRLADQMLSAHTSLAQRYRSRKRAITLSILLLSVLGTALAFAGESHHLDLGFTEPSLPTCAGVLATIVFILALIDLVTAWGTAAAGHEDAARRLASLKALYGASQVVDDEVQSGTIDLHAEYWSVMNSIVAIPNRHFVALKAQHLRKVAQSRALDEGAGMPLPLLRLCLAWKDTRRLCRNGAGPSAADPKVAADDFLVEQPPPPDHTDDGPAAG